MSTNARWIGKFFFGELECVSHSKCRPLCIFERCLDSTPTSCSSKQAGYQPPISLKRKVNPQENWPLDPPDQNGLENIVSGLILNLEKTHCCNRKILHIVRPGGFLYLDIENSVMGNEIPTPYERNPLHVLPI